MRPDKDFWSIPKEEAIRMIGTDTVNGLSGQKYSESRKQSGPNKLTEPVKTTFWSTFWEEVREPMILLLLVVGIIYSIWGKLSDVITIFGVIILLVLSEVYTEFRAHSAISALRKLAPNTTTVIRGGAHLQITAEDVVPGDIVPLESGDRVPADGRVIESFGLEIDESPLTGESSPVAKEDIVLPANVPVSDRTNMAFAGTVVTAGTGKIVICATGMQTEIGKIHGIVQETKQPRTPLQKDMRELSGLLVWVAVAFSVVIPVVSILQLIYINHQPFSAVYKDGVLTGLSLAFCVIPEELPIIVTMVLGLGALTLSQRHVLIRNLRAAETLGSVTTIVADKTGTITENKMTVSRIAANSIATDLPAVSLEENQLRVLRSAAMASSIKKSVDGTFSGDPIDAALLTSAANFHLSPEELQSKSHKINDFAFDHQRQMVSEVYGDDQGMMVYAKGAPESIITACSYLYGQPKSPDADQQVLTSAREMAEQAMRVLAVAEKKVTGKPPTREQAESGLNFVGLIGLADPPRSGVAKAIATTRQAGIRTIMVTGDMAVTALRVAAEVGIQNTSSIVTGSQISAMSGAELQKAAQSTDIFARITPVQKLEIVKALQAKNEIVAVTGDGINDAPALKSADIGIAMGEKGTEAAREAAGMVLTDDSYNSIVDGVREGRKIVDNLRKGLMYYLSAKIAIVLCFLIPLILVVPLPFAPIQIVLLELFMDLAASATFVAEPVERDAMNHAPRDPRQRFIDRKMLFTMLFASLSLAVAVLFNYLFSHYQGKDITEARTVAFGTWMVGHVYLALTMRSQRQTIFKLGIFTNPIMLIWAVAALGFLVLVTNVPALQNVLKVTSLNGQEWGMVCAVPFISIFWHEIKKALTHA